MAGNDQIPTETAAARASLARAAAVGRVKQNWRRADFHNHQKRKSPQRLEKDRAALEKVFAEAENIPIFKEALAWAREHGIEFFVDRTCTKQVGAYYMGGRGIIGINQRVLQNPQLAAVYLTHEIRHAWQDVHGIMAHSQKLDYVEQAVRTALIEADAMAFETVAAHQSARATLKKREAEQGLPKDLAIRLKRIEKYLESEKDDLWRGFRGWFHSPRPYFYGNAVAQRQAEAFGIKGARAEDHKYEFKPTLSVYPRRGPIDATDDADYRKLGTAFSGTNYLNDAQRREFVQRTVISPAQARSFWSGNKPLKLLGDIRKRELKMKLEEATLRFSGYGAAQDIDALKNYLGPRFAAVSGVKDVGHKITEGVMLETTVTFRRGTDLTQAFNMIYSQARGWDDIAPSVDNLDILASSAKLQQCSGRLPARRPRKPAPLAW
jgi:hypothetical protein